jgi:hypothetical protein
MTSACWCPYSFVTVICNRIRQSRAIPPGDVRITRNRVAEVPRRDVVLSAITVENYRW